MYFRTVNGTNRLFKLLVFVFSCAFLVNFWLTKANNKNINTQQKMSRVKQVQFPSKNPICIVLTSEQSITTRGVAVWDTW